VKNMKNKVLIYGANGYTAKLFSKFLKEKSIQPVLAGRSVKVEKTAKELQLDYRVFTVIDADNYLSDIEILVNMAGPFSKTSAALIKACIKTKTHYIDIAGEVPELEKCYSFTEEAKNSGIVILPAAGFGVAPTDVAAKLASTKVKNPTELTIAFATEGEVSRGTLKTVLKDVTTPGVKVDNGSFVKALPAESDFIFTVGDKKFTGVYNPWRADLFTAQISTQIKNIKTFSVFPGMVVSMMKGKLGWLKNLLLNHLIKILPEGPTPNQLKNGRTYVYAEVKNSTGEKGSIELVGPEAYVYTVESLYYLIIQIRSNKQINGFVTPSTFGTDWIKQISGVVIK
jgi:short subunit dehydrogenase-like uncharacterized protein